MTETAERKGLRRAIVLALSGARPDTTGLERAALELGVLPSLRAAAGACDPADVARALMAMVDLARVVAALGDAGIPSVVLKGGALLASGSVRLGGRHTDDLDVLVPEFEAAHALKHLEHLGFVVREGVLHDGTPHRNRATHQMPTMVCPGGTLLEIHTQTHVHGEAFEDVMSDSVEVELALPKEFRAVRVRVPAQWRLFRQLCAHVLDHHAGAVRLWPRHLFDVHLMAGVTVSPEEDPGHVVRRSREVLKGLLDPSESWFYGALASALVLPDPRLEGLVGLVATARRVLTALDDGELRAKVLPDSDHLVFTGDLPPTSTKGMLEVSRARIRRVVRLVRR